jgi:hypothetical protein
MVGVAALLGAFSQHFTVPPSFYMNCEQFVGRGSREWFVHFLQNSVSLR